MANKLKQPIQELSAGPSLPDVLIRASAGTGKTFQLSNRFLSQLCQGALLEQILATTFTRKAAGEILERILIRLAKAAQSDAGLRELSQFLQQPLAQKFCLQLLADMTQSLHRLRIGTLDSFFAQVASCFSLDFGLPPGWRIIDDLTDSQLRMRAIDELLQCDTSEDVVRMMNLITAGDADRSVSQRLKETIAELYSVYLDADESAWHVVPHYSCLSTEELTAARQMLRSVELPADKRFETARLGDCEAAEADDWETFISKGLAAKVLAGVETYHNKQIPGEAVELYTRLVDHARAMLLNQLADQTVATYQMLKRFDTIYRRLKYEVRALKFEDVPRALSQQTEISHSDRFDFRMDGSIAHLLLDEFQDTSRNQWDVIRPFAQRVTESTAASSFFCVGDVKQAIYGWRGGSAEIFETLQNDLKKVEVQTLDDSFRSSQPVIDAVNQVFSHLNQHPHPGESQAAILDWTSKYRKHETRRSELSGHVALLTAPLANDDEDKNEITRRHAAKLVRDLLQKAPGKNIGVLARKNRSVAQMVFELRRLGVAASEEAGNPLLDSPAVEAILALLRMADHPGDRIARFHVARSPISAVVDFHDDRDDRAASRLSQNIRQRLLREGYGPVIYTWAQGLAASCSRRDLSRLKQLVELAYDFHPLATLRPDDFIRQVELERVPDPTAGPVRVMTIHQAKGLQFDSVVLIDLDLQFVRANRSAVVGYDEETLQPDQVCLHRNEKIRALFPPRLQEVFSKAHDRNVTESLCVLYVALTRAVHAMYLVIAPSAPNEKTFPLTNAGLLRASLTEGQRVAPSTTLFETGNAQWYQTEDRPVIVVSDPENRSSNNTVDPKDVLTVKLAPMADGRRRGMSRQTPSMHGNRPAALLVDKLNLGDRTALDRGTLIHAWFEQVEWIDEQWPDEEALRTFGIQNGFDEADVDNYLAQFRDMLRRPTVERLLSQHAYLSPAAKTATADTGNNNALLVALAGLDVKNLRLQVQNEYRVEARVDGTFVDGRIDRLILFLDGEKLIGAEIVDFKTDALGEKNQWLDEKVSGYREQLEVYRRALSQNLLIDVRRISARLLFVGADVVRAV